MKDIVTVDYQTGKTGIYLTDYRDLIQELNKVQPTLIKELQRGYREIAKPVQTAVKSSIPSSPPTFGIHKKTPQNTVSGFYPRVVPGRLTWGSNSQNRKRPVKSVLIETPSVAKAARSMKKSKANASSIARLRVDNAAVVMADMAGKTNKYTNKRRITNEYKYSRSKTGVRRHRVNDQGVAMIKALGGKPSRFVWPAANKAIPKVFVSTNQNLQRTYNIINRRMAA